MRLLRRSEPRMPLRPDQCPMLPRTQHRPLLDRGFRRQARPRNFFARLSLLSRHGPAHEEESQLSIRSRASNPSEGFRDPPSSSPARSDHIPRPSRSSVTTPEVPATFRATTDSRPNPTPPPTVSTPQRMNPASLLQSRSSLGGGGTPICLDFPGSALTPSFPVSGLATPRHPALATNNRDLVGLTWISLDQLGFRAFRSLLQPFTTHLVADNPDQLGFPWISRFPWGQAGVRQQFLTA